MEMNNKLQHLMEQKCTIADCDRKQGMFMEIGFGMVMPFCIEHATKLIELKPMWDKSASFVEKDLRKNNGEVVLIQNYQEWKKRVKSHFQDITTQGLIVTKGKCVHCGKKAIGCKSNFTAVCEEHTGFPLNVLKVAIK